MKKQILFAVSILAVGSLALADDAAKAKVSDAIAKLKAADGYAWTSTTDMGANAQFTPGPVKGKVSKDGMAWVTREFNGNTMETIYKGTNTVAQLGQDGAWGAPRGFGGGRGGGGGGGGGGRGGGRGGFGQAFLTPADEAAALLKDAKDITAGDAGLFSGDFTDDGIKARVGRGGRGGFGRGGGGGGAPPPAPTIKNGKGTVKFWVKDGTLSKYVSHVSGSVEVQDQDPRDVDTTMTVEISGVGSTKVAIPAEAQKVIDNPPAPAQN